MADQSDHKMEDTEMGNPTTVDKGKGKAPQVPEASMEEEEDSSEEESGVEDHGAEETVEAEDEDNMEEINTDNILNGRTRGKNIDFSKAAQELGDEDEEEDDDEDFQDPDDAMEE